MRCRANRGFNLFELALATTIAGILISLFLMRILDLAVEVERVNLLQWEGKVKSVLGLEMSRYVVAGEFEKLERLENINPIHLLDEMPRGYLGEKGNPDLESLPEAAWVYDISRKVLIYIINHSGQFQSGLSGRPRVEYQVHLSYKDNNQNGRFDFKLDRLKSLKLISLGKYHWLRGDD